MNLCSNPSFEIDTDGWTGVRATLARIATDARWGSACMTVTGDGTSFNYARFVIPKPRVEAIDVIVWVKSPVGTLANVRLNLSNGVDADTGTDKSLAAAEGWFELSASFSPSVAANLNVDVYLNYSAGASAAVLRLDAVDVRYVDTPSTFVADVSGGKFVGRSRPERFVDLLRSRSR